MTEKKKWMMWIIGSAIAVIAAGSGLEAWFGIFGLKGDQESTATDKTKPNLTEPALRVRFKSGNECDVYLFVSYALIPEKAPFMYKNYGEQSNADARMKGEIRTAAISELERNDEESVRNDREQISESIIDSLKHLESDPGYKIHSLRIGSITCH